MRMKRLVVTFKMDYKVLLLVFVALVGTPALAQEIWRPRQLGTFPLKFAAFVGLIATEDPDVDPRDKYTLYVSTFNSVALFQKDENYYLRSPGRMLDDVSNWSMTELDKTHYWPNDMNPMPSTVVGTEGIIWTSGFLVPSKTEGHLSMYLTPTDPIDGPYNIATNDDKDYSYHRVEWYDVNHDGLLDAVSARFHVNGADTTKSCVWFENPGTGQPSEGWTQHIIFEEGPDVHFKLAYIPVADKEFFVMVAAEFWNEQITLYYAEDGSDSFLSDPSTLIQLKIDVTVGQSFDVAVTDLNLDGRPEFLLTAFNFTEGNVMVFPVPNDFRTDGFERHVIATGFIPNLLWQGNRMSPGAPKSYYRDIEHENSGNKPYVFISGDDDGHHYILTPDSEDPNNWSYTKNMLVNTNDTTSGKFAIADLDNDGYNEIIAAAYSAGEMYVYTYKP